MSTVLARRPGAGSRRNDPAYRPGTLVLETEFETADGTVRVIDCMPARQEHPRLVRVVEGLRGSVPMFARCVPRFDYGKTTTVDPRIEAPS